MPTFEINVVTKTKHKLTTESQYLLDAVLEIQKTYDEDTEIDFKALSSSTANLGLKIVDIERPLTDDEINVYLALHGYDQDDLRDPDGLQYKLDVAKHFGYTRVIHYSSVLWHPNAKM